MVINILLFDFIIPFFYHCFMMKYITIKNLGWLLTFVVTLMLGMSGISKIMGTQEMVNNFTFMNLLPYLALVGAMELIGVLLLIYPRTSIYGAVVLTSVMSAAAAMHLSYMGGNGVVMPIILGLLAWTGHCLRTYDVKKIIVK
jgi:uncharacterized membrane protein YphA (DoxX/SURF4 family)